MQQAIKNLLHQNMKLLQIWQDEDVESPRLWENLGQMVCWHRRYCLGDPHNFSTPNEFLEWAKQTDMAVMLPLYLYDHSGLTISTDGSCYPYNDRFDAGQVGWIYVTKARLCQERNVKRLTKQILDWATSVLITEVQLYDMYLRNEIYGFTVFEATKERLEEIDSCGGFFGDDPKTNGMLFHVPAELKQPLRDAGYISAGTIITENGNVYDLRTDAKEIFMECCMNSVIV